MYQIETFELNTAHVVAYQLKVGCVIRVTSGRLWLTRQGSPDDIWLQAGESWTMPVANGTLWLSAEPAAEFQIAQAITLRRRPSLHQPLGFGAKLLANAY